PGRMRCVDVQSEPTPALRSPLPSRCYAGTAARRLEKDVLVSNDELSPIVVFMNTSTTFCSEPSALGGVLEPTSQGLLEVFFVLDADTTPALSHVLAVERHD